MHINENGNLEVCSIGMLRRNILNGRVIAIDVFGLDSAGFYQLICEHAQANDSKFLILSADPFCLPDAHAHKLSHLSLPIGLILCDTHHGVKPLTRCIKFSRIAGVQSVLLRFNQRHEIFFRLHGFWADSTVLSPDLHSIALAGLGFMDAGRMVYPLKEQFMRSFADATGSYKSVFDSGLFVGSMERVHPFRSAQIQQLLRSQIPLDIRSTPTPQAMIELLSSYRWGLNLPLNGDFNRRFIEIFLAGIPVLSERIPKSQLRFPFSIFSPFIHFYDFSNFSSTVKIPLSFSNALAEQETFRTPLRAVLSLVASGYDYHILTSFCKSLTVNKRNQSSAPDASLSQMLEAYERCLHSNISPVDIALSDASLMLLHANDLCGPLGINVFDEFSRLANIAFSVHTS